MAKRSFKVSSFTPVAVADTAAMTSGGYMSLIGGSTTQFTSILEVMLAGQAAASAPSPMILARDSTLAITPTALSTGNSDAPLNPLTAALAAPVVPFVAAGTGGQRAATLGLLNLSFNAFGGAIRWVAAPGEEITMYGNAVNAGEVSLSSYTGGAPGLMGGHIIYETA